MIIQNAAKCNKCGDFIVSKHRHDYVTCHCGAISVDGGQAYLRRAGGLGKMPDGRPWYTDMSWELSDDLYEACAAAVEEAIETNRNKYGIANAVMRQLRADDRIIADHEPRIMAKNKDLDEIMVVESDGTINRYKKVIVE